MSGTREEFGTPSMRQRGGERKRVIERCIEKGTERERERWRRRDGERRRA